MTVPVLVGRTLVGVLETLIGIGTGQDAEMNPTIRPGRPALRWRFPELNGGEERGINDAGIESFHGSDRLARETCQNIIDAHDPALGESAIAQFETFEIPTTEIPDRERLVEAYRDARRYCLTDSRGDPSAERAAGKQIFDRALSLLEGTSLPVLRIGDYNTTGLVGSDTEKGSPWHRLIRSQGRPKNEAGKGGTFGIGQRAPFAFSDVRTVFYSTRLRDGSTRFMGKTILCSHPDQKGVIRQNVGFLGAEESGLVVGVADEGLIPEKFRRSRNHPGTDLYLLGFSAEQWKERVIRSLLANFFASIHVGKLQAYVLDHDGEDVAITSAELGRLFSEYKLLGTKSEQLLISTAEQYYLALLDPLNAKPFTESLPGLGEVRLYIRRDTAGPQKVAYMRRPRILVYQRANNVLSGYAGVIIVDDPTGNELLAGLENPEHDEWKIDNASRLSREERGVARRSLAAMREYVRRCLEGLATSSATLEEDLPGLPDYMVIDDADLRTGAGAGSDGDPVADGEDIDSRPKAGEVPVEVGYGPRGRAQAGEGQTGEVEGVTGEGGKNAGAGGDQPGDGVEPGAGRGDKSGEDQADYVLGTRDVSVRSWQVGADPRAYALCVRARRACSGKLDVLAAGDDGSYPISILSATDGENGRSLRCRDGSIVGLILREGETMQLRVMIATSMPLCLRSP